MVMDMAGAFLSVMNRGGHSWFESNCSRLFRATPRRWTPTGRQFVRKPTRRRQAHREPTDRHHRRYGNRRNAPSDSIRNIRDAVALAHAMSVMGRSELDLTHHSAPEARLWRADSVSDFRAAMRTQVRKVTRLRSQFESHVTSTSRAATASIASTASSVSGRSSFHDPRAPTSSCPRPSGGYDCRRVVAGAPRAEGGQTWVGIDRQGSSRRASRR